jgi:hypothetical protein
MKGTEGLPSNDRAKSPVLTDLAINSPVFEDIDSSLVSETLVDERLVDSSVTDRAMPTRKGGEKTRNVPTPALSEEDEILPEFLASRVLKPTSPATSGPAEDLSTLTNIPGSPMYPTKDAKGEKVSRKTSLSPNVKEDELSQVSESTLVAARSQTKALANSAAASGKTGKKGRKEKKDKKKAITALEDGSQPKQGLEPTALTETTPPANLPVLEDNDSSAALALREPEVSSAKVSREKTIDEPSMVLGPSPPIFPEIKKDNGIKSSFPQPSAGGETLQEIKPTSPFPENLRLDEGSTRLIPETTVTATEPPAQAIKTRMAKKDKEGERKVGPIAEAEEKPSPPAEREVIPIATPTTDVMGEPVAHSEPYGYALEKEIKGKQKGIQPWTEQEKALSPMALGGPEPTLAVEIPTKVVDEATAILEPQAGAVIPKDEDRKGKSIKEGSASTRSLTEGDGPPSTMNLPPTLPIQDLEGADEISLPPPTPEQPQPDLSSTNTTASPETFPALGLREAIDTPLPFPTPEELEPNPSATAGTVEVLPAPAQKENKIPPSLPEQEPPHAPRITTNPTETLSVSTFKSEEIPPPSSPQPVMKSLSGTLDEPAVLNRPTGTKSKPKNDKEIERKANLTQADIGRDEFELAPSTTASPPEIPPTPILKEKVEVPLSGLAPEDTRSAPPVVTTSPEIPNESIVVPDSPTGSKDKKGDGEKGSILKPERQTTSRSLESQELELARQEAGSPSQVVDELITVPNRPTKPEKKPKKEKKEKKGKKRASLAWMEEEITPPPSTTEELESPFNPEANPPEKLSISAPKETEGAPPLPSAPRETSDDVTGRASGADTKQKSKKEKKGKKSKKSAARAKKDEDIPPSVAESETLESSSQVTTAPPGTPPISISQERGEIQSPSLRSEEPQFGPTITETPAEILQTHATKETAETLSPLPTSRELEPIKASPAKVLPIPTLKALDEIPLSRELDPVPSTAISPDAINKPLAMTDPSPQTEPKLEKGKDKIPHSWMDEGLQPPPLAQRELEHSMGLPETLPESPLLLEATATHISLSFGVTPTSLHPEILEEPLSNAKTKSKKDKKGKKKNVQALAEENIPSPPLAPVVSDELGKAIPDARGLSDESLTVTDPPFQTTKPKKSKKGKKGSTQALIEKDETLPPQSLQWPDSTQTAVTPADIPEKSAHTRPKKGEREEAFITPALVVEVPSPLTQNDPEPTKIAATSPLEIADESTEESKNDKKRKREKSLKEGEPSLALASPVEVLDRFMGASDPQAKRPKKGENKATCISSEDSKAVLIPATPKETSDEPGAVPDSSVSTRASREVKGKDLEKASHHPDLPRDQQIKPNAETASPTVISQDQPREAEHSIQTPDRRPTRSPSKAASPTAVPLLFRRPPALPGFSRSHLQSPGAPPQSAPARRGSRPNSTEFKSSTGFRPLYLLERHMSRQEVEQEETYPSLPSSRTTSRSPSLQSLDGKEAREATEDPGELSQHAIGGSQQWGNYREEFGQSHPGLGVDEDRVEDLLEPSRELLGSGQSTPKAPSFPLGVHDDISTVEHGEPQHVSTGAQASIAHHSPPSRELVHSPGYLFSLETSQNHSFIGDLPSLPLSRPDSPYTQHGIGTGQFETEQNDQHLGKLPSPPLSRPSSPYNKQQQQQQQQEGTDTRQPIVPRVEVLSRAPPSATPSRPEPRSVQQQSTLISSAEPAERPQSKSVTPESEQQIASTWSIQAAQNDSPIRVLPAPLSTLDSSYTKQQSTKTEPRESVREDPAPSKHPSFPSSKPILSPVQQQRTDTEPDKVAHDVLSTREPPIGAVNRSGSFHSELPQATVIEPIEATQNDGSANKLLSLDTDRPDSTHSEQGQRTNSSSSDPLNISVELDSSYELSISRPHKDHPESDSAPSIEVVWNPQERRTENETQVPTSTRSETGIVRSRSIDDLPEPSPVESTSKERDSILFKSPPAKDRLGGSPSPRPSPESPNRGRSKQVTPPARDTVQLGTLAGAQRRIRSDADQSPSPQPRGISDTHTLSHQSSAPKESSPRPSIFGSPVGASSDIATPARSGISIATPEKRQLGTISENSPDSPPLSKKSRSAPGYEPTSHAMMHELPSISPEIPRDEGAPTQSIDPTGHTLPTSTRGTKLISTDDLLARLSWPTVDENEHTVDIGRGAGAGTGADNKASKQLERSMSPITPERPSVRETLVRSPTSARSPASINRHRTPEDARDSASANRPASVLSNRAASALSNRSAPGVGSPRTPPLRRVDRSVSGDLRAASKREQAKEKARSRPPPAELVLPSSSTYDPVKDKGKGRARDMADVYVSSPSPSPNPPPLAVFAAQCRGEC